MSNIGSVRLNRRENISVFLAEYTTLRAEILQRNTILNQFLTVSITAFLGIISISFVVHSWLVGLILLIVLPTLIWLAFKFVEFDTLAAAARIRELEAAINKLAGKRLLVWETDRGIYQIGYGSRLKHAIHPIAVFLNRFHSN